MRRLLVIASLFVGLLVPFMSVHAASGYSDLAFLKQWQQGEAITPNFWGPLSLAKDGQQEPYKEASGGKRLVQYFDKGRMELTNGVVTNGLLATEIVKGQIQTGNATFQAQPSPAIPIAGDSDNAGPTYAQLGNKAKTLFEAAPSQTGNSVQAAVSQSGDISVSSTGRSDQATFVAFDDVTKHNVPKAFADYRAHANLLTIGLALCEPFYAMVKVDGQPKQVMVQVFERRVLTYTSSNPDAFKVEMGNIGQHYYQWRYGGTAPAPSASATVTPPSASAMYPGKIVYETGPGDANAPVYVMNADGSGKIKVGYGWSPLFSADGARIAYYFLGSEIPNTAGISAAIYSVNPDGSATRDEVTFSTGSYDTLVRWSPSGRYIAMNSAQEGAGLISLLDTTTGNFSKRLKYLQGDVSLVFDWTSDGSTALWQASQDLSKPQDLYYGDPDKHGEGAIQLTHGENQIAYPHFHYYACARISPDGKTIAVAGSKVFFLSVPGQNSPLAGKSLDGFPDVYSLAWSPDGRALAVARRLSSSRDDTGRSLSVVDIASGQIVTSVPGAGRADWSRQ